MKGGITDNGEESQGREEEGREETLTDLARRKKGGHRGPLSIFSPQFFDYFSVIVSPSHTRTFRITSHC